ncbi:hypothetical protein E4U55_000229 [Claviceps digitariae]|nr:hypothetical protein E4U55_000229 [Claviceps digitariae]
MALEAPVRSSNGSLQFPFGKQGDMSSSSDPEGRRSPFRVLSSPPPATDSAMLRPNSVNRISSIPMNLMSPSDVVGPSPVTSNGTETTEIEDDASDEIEQRHSQDVFRPSEISWSGRKSPSSDRTSPEASEEASAPSDDNESIQKPSENPPRPPISTDVKPVRYSLENATPRAQDFQDMLGDDSRLRSSSTSSLEKIDEQTEAEGDDDDDGGADNDENDEYSGVPLLRPADDEITALRTALQECWTLCKTLASLSALHRARSFHSFGTPSTHVKAWKTCWKLCQRLYENQDEDPASLSVRMNLDLCRDFCQALFDIRQKKDETADSVLRVSFELNNQYAHDRA